MIEQIAIDKAEKEAQMQKLIEERRAKNNRGD